MSQVFYLFAASLMLVAALAAITIWSPRALWGKGMALTIVTLFLPAVYVSLVELLSRPKPVTLEWRQGGLAEAKVIGADLREGEAIFVWLRLPDAVEPRAYALPWDQKLAEQLYGAQREAASRGTAVHVKHLFKNSVDRQPPKFYALPQPAQPPKAVPPHNPLIYEAPLRDDGRGGI
jgi:hypothetical protein